MQTDARGDAFFFSAWDVDRDSRGAAIPNMTHKGQKSLKHFGFGSLKDHTR
jgi:hypothetical protein